MSCEGSTAGRSNISERCPQSGGNRRIFPAWRRTRRRRRNPERLLFGDRANLKIESSEAGQWRTPRDGRSPATLISAIHSLAAVETRRIQVHREAAAAGACRYKVVFLR